MLDPTGLVMSWNRGAQRIKGYQRREILGHNFAEFYVDQDRRSGEPQHRLEMARRNGRYETQGWRVRKDGSRFWANVVIDPIRKGTGELLGYAKVTRDITALAEARVTLEKTREALFQSQKLEAIGQLTGGVAHDFNNLLTALVGNLELLKMKCAADADRLPHVSNALAAAERGIVLTSRMLSFARQQVLKPESVDVFLLVDGMADLMRHSLKSGLLIEVTIAETIGCVKADAHQLELALLNLVINARDAMDTGTIRIGARGETLSLPEEKLPPGNYVVVSVSDCGSGMDADTLKKAIEPFFTTKENGKGTGLGLSMVFGLAEQSGGRLTLESAPGEGTLAEIWLPRSTAGMDDSDAAEDRARWPERRSRRILLVDDDEIVLAATTGVLQAMGHSVVQASSGDQALQHFKVLPDIDVVVTDFVMPGMSGLDLIDALSLERRVPMILVSGFFGTDQLFSCPTLKKPFTPGQLMGLLETV